jgi:hypothetical protein
MATESKSPSPMIAKSPDLSSSPTPAGTRKASPRPGSSRVARTRPDALLEEIRAHLGEGRYRTAQRLAKSAAARFPDHAGIATLNRGLNERRVRTRPATGQGRTEELEWLKNPPPSAKGKWVALVGSQVVAAAEALAEVVASLEAMTLAKTPLVHRVD